MRLFKRKKKDELLIADMFMDQESDKDVMDIAIESNELLNDILKRSEDTRLEYDSITSYLTDIVRIDGLSYDDRAEIDDAARKIINLNKEREKHQNKDHNLNDPQYVYVRQYEDVIPDEITKIEGYEKYQQLVKNDMKHLEGERGTIIYKKERAYEKRAFIKKFSIVIAAVILGIFLLIFSLADMVKANLNTPFMLTGVMAALAAAYIIFGMRSTARAINESDAKMNRLIILVNKVKIKYVNTTNVIDYLCDKYHVNGSTELRFIWGKYVAAKDEAKLYRHNTELLELYSGILVEELEKYGIRDPEIWIYQPEALLDEREMVEVRHKLNVRRQKLRERMLNNDAQIERCKTEIMALRKKFPEYDEAIMRIFTG